MKTKVLAIASVVMLCLALLRVMSHLFPGTGPSDSSPKAEGRILSPDGAPISSEVMEKTAQNVRKLIKNDPSDIHRIWESRFDRTLSDGTIMHLIGQIDLRDSSTQADITQLSYADDSGHSYVVLLKDRASYSVDGGILDSGVGTVEKSTFSVNGQTVDQSTISNTPAYLNLYNTFVEAEEKASRFAISNIDSRSMTMKDLSSGESLQFKEITEGSLLSL